MSASRAACTVFFFLSVEHLRSSEGSESWEWCQHIAYAHATPEEIRELEREFGPCQRNDARCNVIGRAVARAAAGRESAPNADDAAEAADAAPVRASASDVGAMQKGWEQLRQLKEMGETAATAALVRPSPPPAKAPPTVSVGWGDTKEDARHTRAAPDAAPDDALTSWSETPKQSAAMRYAPAEMQSAGATPAPSAATRDARESSAGGSTMSTPVRTTTRTRSSFVGTPSSNRHANLEFEADPTRGKVLKTLVWMQVHTRPRRLSYPSDISRPTPHATCAAW